MFRGTDTAVAAAVFGCLGFSCLGLLGVLKLSGDIVLAVLLAAVAAVLAAKRGGRDAHRVLAGETGAGFGRLAASARRLFARSGEDDGIPVTATLPPAPPPGPGPAPFAPAAVPPRGAVQRPAIRARRGAAAAAGPAAMAVPAEWGAVVAATADFRSESNVEFAAWLTGQVLGAFAWAESMVEQHEAARDEQGVDPAAIAALDDVAAAIIGCAETTAGAVSRFCQHFELPDAFVDAGGKLAHDGNWHQGSPDL
jgi:hypothetical protein